MAQTAKLPVKNNLKSDLVVITALPLCSVGNDSIVNVAYWKSSWPRLISTYFVILLNGLIQWKAMLAVWNTHEIIPDQPIGPSIYDAHMEAEGSRVDGEVVKPHVDVPTEN